jgi:hypothetical protein
VSDYAGLVERAIELALGDLFVAVREDDLEAQDRRIIGRGRVDFLSDPISPNLVVRVQPLDRPPVFFRVTLTHGMEDEWGRMLDRQEQMWG